MPATGEKEGEMPREKFWQPDNVGNEQPDLTIRWAPEVLFVQGDILVTREDTTGLDRMIQSLKRARRALYGDLAHRAPCVSGSVCGEASACPPAETPPASVSE